MVQASPIRIPGDKPPLKHPGNKGAREQEVDPDLDLAENIGPHNWIESERGGDGDRHHAANTWTAYRCVR